MMTQANFLFCVGAQKAGTTWLYSYFAAHPQVHVQPTKEIHYFNVLWDRRQAGFRRNRENHLAALEHSGKSAIAGAMPAVSVSQGDGGSYEESRRLVEMYASEEPDHAAYRRLMLNGAAGKSWVADITPDYSVLGGRRYRQMGDAFPGSKFLYLMRDPVQRMWSHLKMRAEWMCTHVKPGTTPGDVLQKVLEGREKHILDRSNYRGTLFALGHLPADRVKYMFYETMFADDTIADLCDFLGIDFHPGNYSHRVRGGGGSLMTVEQRNTMRWLLAPSYKAVSRAFGGEVPASWDASAAEAQIPDFLDRSKIDPSVLERLG